MASISFVIILFQDKDLAMFVEDFIIDAYDIQLREEVGNISVVQVLSVL